MPNTLQTVASFGRIVRIFKDLIEKQVEELSVQVGCTVKANMLSPIMLLSEKGALATAEIARRLNDSHQLTTQRVNWLLDHGYIRSSPDKNDGRRRVNSLTAKGKKEATKINSLSKKLARAYQSLFDDIDANLFELVKQSIDLLNRNPIEQRIK